MTADDYTMATLAQFIGREIGVSSWHPVEQEQIDAFADCTGDRQWIHVDVERARRESPYRGTIAHGYLTLSLAATLAIEAGIIPKDAGPALNYGLDKARFLTPVRAGARIRNRVTLMLAESKQNGRVLISYRNAIEIEGEEKPALVADGLALLMATG